MVKLNLNSAYIRLFMIKEDCSLLDYILDFMLVQQTLLQIRIKYYENQSTVTLSTVTLSNAMLNQSTSHFIKRKLLQIVLYIL